MDMGINENMYEGRNVNVILNNKKRENCLKFSIF